MPDVDTGARGVCTVNCISANVDKNDDGAMGLSLNGPDATSQTSPYRVWVNSGHDEPGKNGNLDFDKEFHPPTKLCRRKNHLSAGLGELLPLVDLWCAVVVVILELYLYVEHVTFERESGHQCL